MNINATFFIQLFHFFIAYIILDRLLLRPWFSIIQDDEQTKATLNVSLDEARQQVHEKELLKQRLWEEARHTFSKATPPLSHAPSISFVARTPSPSLFMLDTQAMERYKEEMEHYLITRLGNHEL